MILFTLAVILLIAIAIWASFTNIAYGTVLWFLVLLLFIYIIYMPDKKHPINK